MNLTSILQSVQRREHTCLVEAIGAILLWNIPLHPAIMQVIDCVLPQLLWS
jgi:hypothetical protein